MLTKEVKTFFIQKKITCVDSSYYHYYQLHARITWSPSELFTLITYTYQSMLECLGYPSCVRSITRPIRVRAKPLTFRAVLLSFPIGRVVLFTFFWETNKFAVFICGLQWFSHFGLRLKYRVSRHVCLHSYNGIFRCVSLII